MQPASAFDEVKVTIEKALGKPLDALFAVFEETPIASASIAQVHRATLPDGRRVVVKVQHSTISAILPQDLQHLRKVVGWIAYLADDYDFRPMLHEWSTEAIKGWLVGWLCGR
jgi:aarF domain-containing kinase